MGFAKMGLRFLAKRKLRTGLTVLAIVLGVGILTGVNVTADSIDAAVRAQIDSQLGNNDLIVRGNKSVDGGWFDLDAARGLVGGVDGVDLVVPRIAKSAPSYPLKNKTSGWNALVVAVDASDPAERSFGKCNLTGSLDDSFENTSSLEALLQRFDSVFDLPVVVSKSYADSFNLTPGDPLYFFPEDDIPFGGGINATNTSTWLEATVVGVVVDTSEGVSDFKSPARVWDLTPPSTAVYLDLADAWKYVFNNHSSQVNMLFVKVSNPGEAETVRERILDLGTDVFPGRVFVENVKGLFAEGITQVNFLMRGLFSLFSAISLLVSAIIIKNLLEMAKEEQTTQIGIMRAIGVTKSKILELYMVQILFISVVGSLLGILFGYGLSTVFVGSYVDAARALGTDLSGYSVSPVISAVTLLIGLSSGIGISLLFGFLPARAAANLDPLEALRSSTEKPKDSLVVRTIKKTTSLSVALGFTVGGIVLLGSSFGGLFLLDVMTPGVIAFLFLGGILLIVGIVLLASLAFPVVVPAITGAFQPILRKMRTITGRNLRRYSRQTKNTFAMLAIGLCMMIFVGTIMNSAYVGAYPGGRTIVGGDIRVGDLSRGHIPKDPHTAGLKGLPSVAQAVPVRFSLGFEGISRIDRVSTNKTFGGVTDSLLGPVRETFHLGIVDPGEYAKLHSHDSVVKLQDKRDTLSAVMSRLEDPYTIALQDRLARRLGGVTPGERVRVRFEGFEAEFEVVGVFSILPGFQTTYYTTDSPFDKQFSGAISWTTYEQLVGDHVGSADLIARNRVVPPDNYTDLLPDENLWGYASTPLDYQTLENLMAQTGLVENSTRRVTSPFWGIPTFQWDGMENGSVSWHEAGDAANWSAWNSMFSRFTTIDPDTDRGFGNTTIVATLPEIPAGQIHGLEDLFAWTREHMPGQDVAVVNEYYVDLNASSGEWDYVKRFTPGETIRMYVNETVQTNFTVVATTNSHYPYAFTSGKSHVSDTGVLNYKALSFNTYTYNTTDWDYFFEVLDAEPNSIFLPSYLDPFEGVPGDWILHALDDLIGNATGGTNSSGGDGGDSSSWWLDQALGDMFNLDNSSYGGSIASGGWVANYFFDGANFSINGTQFAYLGNDSLNFTLTLPNGQWTLDNLTAGTLSLGLQNLTSEVTFDLADDLTFEELRDFVQTMENVCRAIPTLRDICLFAPMLFLVEDSGLFDVFFWIGAIDKEHIGAALLEVENYYLSHGLPWDSSWVKLATENEDEVGGVLGLVTNMFFGVLAFALVSSLLGLAISTIISVKKRYAEIGTLRTLGFSNGQVLRMVVSESMITAIFGILVGIIAGLIVAWVVLVNLPFMIFLPLVFAPPLQTIGAGVGILLCASMGASFIPAVSAVRLDIADAIRTKGE
ncbi:MAG: FtsX-like permease family protein [Promethearchaeota archaeon]